MSFRGRGGFGGRGRGFGGRGFIPQARGDDGQPVFAKKQEGPPELFPKLASMPDLPDIGKKEEELVSRRRRLETFWNASPYFVEKPKDKTVGVAAEIERYSDKYKPNFKVRRLPLSSVLKLMPAYFPTELLGQQDRKRLRDGEYKGGSQWTLEPSSAKNDLERLDRLANLEQRGQKLLEKEGKDAEEKKPGEGDDEEKEEVEDEEEEFGEDDYGQNFGFDDDDEYGDDDDLGDDEGPTF